MMKRINKKYVEDILAVTPMQEGMLFHYLENPRGSQYFEQLCLSVSGQIDLQRFRQAWNFVIDTNEMLRTAFRWEEIPKPVQVVLKEHTVNVNLRFHDLSCLPKTNGGSSEETKLKHLDEIKAGDRAEKFDLSDVPFRVTLCKLKRDKHEIIISNHHILYDGWSNGILLREFLDAYHVLSQDKEPVRPVKNKFKEYVKWIHNRDSDKQEAYWKEYLRGFNTKTDVSIKSKKSNQSEGTRDYLLQFTGGMKEKLARFAKERKLTLATLFYCTWGILLQKYNNCSDVVFGSTVSGRNAKIDGLENMIGLFINTLPLRITANPGENILTLLHNVDKSLQIRDEYTGTPLANIKKWSEIDAGQEMFASIMILENYPLDKSLLQENGQLWVQSYSIVEEINYDVIAAVLIDDTINVVFTYKRQLFDEAAVSRMSAHFMRIIQCMTADPGKEPADVDIISEEEKKQLLNEFNDTTRGFPTDKTIHELLEEQAERIPDHVALVGQIPNKKDISITYKELNEKSDQLAYVLMEKRVQPDTIVGIMAERSPEMITGILGILKAGGGYLPIDPDYPHERINFMLKDSGAIMLVTTTEIFKEDGKIGRWEDSRNLEIVLLDFSTRPSSHLHLSPAPVTSLAYIIYTSGSTGTPKGVMVEHRNLVAYIHAFYRVCDITPADTVLQQASFTFDVFVEEVFPTLLKGGKIAIPQKGEIPDIDLLSAFITKNNVNIIDSSPLLLNELNRSGRSFDSVHTCISGGDVLKKEYVGNFLKTGKVLNSYGPTEITVCVTFYKCKGDEAPDIPIGKPIANYKVYILDKNNQLLPVGIPGELCAAGAGVTRGYLNQPELTAKKFIRAVISHSSLVIGNPSKTGDRYFKLSPNVRFYKTGDRARWLLDGNIEYLGRIDQQVKVRGFRIELGEIENHLMAWENIKEAVVVAKDRKDGENELCSYLVSNKKLSVTQLREYLTRKLPLYMLPAYFVQLEKMPLTTSGKADRRKLAALDIKPLLKVEYEEPRNRIEERLVEVWQEILEVEQLGINNHFIEMGGDSIKAIQAAARLQKHGLKVQVRDLFLKPTIKQLSQYVKQEKIAGKTRQGIVRGRVQLTPIQRWFFERSSTNCHHFNQALMLYREEGFDEVAIKKVVKKLVEHHDALRMVYLYEKENNRSIQENRPMKGKLFDLETVNLRGKNQLDPGDAIQGEANRIQKGIDLNRGPLVRLGLFKTQEGDHLLMVIHHLVVDGISWRILLEDFAIGYKQVLHSQAIQFQEKTDSYQYWSHQLSDYAKNKELLQELEYWKVIEETEVKPLPGRHQVEQKKRIVKNTAVANMNLGNEETDQLLKQANRAYNTEINDLLLTALALSFKMWAGIDRVLINLEGHGREPIIQGINVNRTVGWFTSQFPVLLDVGQSEDLSYNIKSVKETLRRIPNRGIGYGILRYLTPGAQKKGIQLKKEPQISFNYLGQFGQDTHYEGVFRISPRKIGDCISPESEKNNVFDINGIVENGKLKLSFAYNTFEYERSNVETWIRSYKSQLIEIVRHCTRKEEKELTPSDVGDKHLTIEQLKDIQEMLDL